MSDENGEGEEESEIEDGDSAEEMPMLTRPMRILSGGGGGWPQDQFYIWKWQPHFAISVKGAAERLFAALDKRLTPDTFLIAVNTDDASEHPRIVIEPNDHSCKPKLFDGLLEQVKHFESVSPGMDYAWQGDDARGRAWAESHMRGDYLTRIKKVIKRIVIDQYDGNAPYVYVSYAREIGPYAIYTVLQLPKYFCDLAPHLNRTKKDEFRVETSLIHSAASVFVDACWNTLPLSQVGNAGFTELPDTDTMLRKAGYSFMHTVTLPADNHFGLHMGFHTCNTISAMTYERADSKGQMIISRIHHPNLTETVVFSSPRKVDDYRAVRKLLQLPNADEALLCDSAEIYGVGRLADGYDPNNEDLFCVEFIGHAKWQVLHAGVPLMRVEYGVPSLPSERIHSDQFSATFQRLFPDASGANVKLVKYIATAATRLSHGTIVVMTPDAEAEAARFGVQATRLTPVKVDEKLMDRSSRIDGAMLMSPDGICYAIGVILDGEATAKGTAERGARYNSAIRYVYSRKSPCLALVVSDDGMIDSVPPYRPRCSRREIEDHLSQLRRVVQKEKVTQREVNKPTNWLNENRFYLSESQCAEINKLLNDSESKRGDGTVSFRYSDFKPHPDMNESFLID
jgi:hypothetical protein